MSVARINCSHGDHAQYRRFIKNIRAVSKDMAVMFDTQGPEIRTGKVEPGTVLKTGSVFTLTTRDVMGDDKQVSVTYKGLVNDVRKGDMILIDSGFIELKVLKKSKTEIFCRVVDGGNLGSQKGVNHPACMAKIPGFTKKDKEDLRFGKTVGIDFVAASFVRGPNDILKIREFLGNDHVKILAKIENARAVENFDKILEVADGIMVARGDLGVELPAADVPIIQKELIYKCNLAGKPVVTATQMLESMVRSPRPTRAEVSDVANAIFDGTDAVMLSEETAVGKYPARAVDFMVKIAEKTESVLELHREREVVSPDDAIASAAFTICEQTGVDNIVVATCSGYSARLISKYRPHANIIAVTPSDHVVRQMGIYWGIIPVMLKDSVHSTRDLIYYSVLKAHKNGLLKNSDKIVVTAAHPFNIRGKTNLLEMHTVGELIRRGASAR
jgi:pyruvate kinase